MKIRTLAASLLLLPWAAWAQTAPLISLEDPEGDDVGDGSLIYPREAILEPGDLDLRSLRVFADPAGLRVEATFRNPIRDPAQVKSGLLGTEDLSVFARRGFYAFNLDLYVDLDRRTGSGNTVTLPGRRALIDAAHAWEKAIVLTPRPELMRRQLGDALVEAGAEPGAAAPSNVEATIDGSVFFARDVRVRGRTVSFTVPRSFIDPQALAGASIVALVTAAKVSVEADLSAFTGRSGTRAVDRLALGAMQPEAGRPAQTLGWRGDKAPATAVVDLLAPAGSVQAAQLGAGTLVGLNRDNRYGAALAAPAAAAPARPGAIEAPAAQASTGNWFSRALGAVAGWVGLGGGSAPAAPAAAAPAGSLQTLMQPAGAAPARTGTAPAAVVEAPKAAAAAAATAPTPATAPRAPAAIPAAPAAAVPAAVPAAAAAAPAAAPGRPRDAAYFEEQELRLRTLQRLRERGLISEEEYQKKRKEVLDGI